VDEQTKRARETQQHCVRTLCGRAIVVITDPIACGVCMRSPWRLLLPAFFLVYRGMASLADAVEATSSVCHSQIYCEGPILHAVQMADLFNDSKVFVDLPLKFSPDIVLSNFAALNWNSSTSPATDLLKFVTDNFGPVDSDLLRWTPPDWEAAPSFLKRLSHNDEYLSFAKSVHQLWLSLGREAVPMVKAMPERYSLLYTPHPMIVPGGRFRESYYWDTFWIVKGLLVSDMVTTAKHLVENLLHLCSVYGFVPNGNRIYYTTRSQPPLLSDMVRVVYNALSRQSGPGARAFLESALPVLEKEYRFWSNNRAARKFAPLCIYNAETTLPRPESYREDVALASDLTSPAAKEALFTNIAAAAESGWDFSSRWFRDGRTLQTIDTTAIIPVDLNVYMLRFECNMARFYNASGNPSKAAEFIANAVARHDRMEKLLWNDESKQWNDYSIAEGKLKRMLCTLRSTDRGTVSLCQTMSGSVFCVLRSEVLYLHHIFMSSVRCSTLSFRSELTTNYSYSILVTAHEYTHYHHHHHHHHTMFDLVYAH
jgi:alpha,alpha-trehalase